MSNISPANEQISLLPLNPPPSPFVSSAGFITGDRHLCQENPTPDAYVSASKECYLKEYRPLSSIVQNFGDIKIIENFALN